jgi:uncharacterized protein (TIGR03067 family)
MRAVLMVAVLAVAVPDRPNPRPNAARPFAEQLPGEWQVVTALTNGRPHLGTKPGEAVFIFEGDRMTISRPTLKNIYAFTIDTTKNPWTIDMKSVNIGGKAVKSAGTVPGIVKLENGTLSLCFKSGGPRPSEFTSTPDSRTILWQLKRGKN